MKTLLLSTLGALTVGGFMGWSVHGPVNNSQMLKSDRQAENPRLEQTVQSSDQTPDAADFVSLRPAVTELVSEDISPEEEAGLRFMREEEKLARDVYITLYEKWGLQIFSNIAQSEQTHTEAVRTLLEKYAITDPVVDDSIGVFVNTDLQKLYTDLVAQGVTSLEEALVVGATIEDLDIADLEKQIALTDNADIKLVYENLMRGSRNHLRSFISQLSARNATYTPSYIDQAAFESIVSSDRETGAGSGRGGSGTGRGWGGR